MTKTIKTKATKVSPIPSIWTGEPVSEPDNSYTTTKDEVSIDTLINAMENAHKVITAQQVTIESLKTGLLTLTQRVDAMGQLQAITEQENGHNVPDFTQLLSTNGNKSNGKVAKGKTTGTTYTRLIDDAVQSAISGIKSNAFNVNIVPLIRFDLRPFVTRATNKALKVYRDSVKGTANAITLAQISRDIVTQYNGVSNMQASVVWEDDVFDVYYEQKTGKTAVGLN